MELPMKLSLPVILIASCFLIPTARSNDAIAAGPVKVFILSGQSNMEGKAAAYTLEAAIEDSPNDPLLARQMKDGSWVVRDDVWVTFLGRMDKQATELARKYGPLTVGFGSQKTRRNEEGRKIAVAGIGPELGIGQALGDHFDEPVLLIKAAWGGRAVRYSFRPPSAMPNDDEIRAEVAAIKERKPDAAITFESYKEGYGRDYHAVLSETKKVLDNIGTYVPGYDKSQGYEIAGFIWFQGWNDAIGDGNPQYVDQMRHFIRDMRKDLGVPNLPFVIGELGTDGEAAEGWISIFRRQQAEIAATPEFKGTVRLAKTAQFWPNPPDMNDKWQAFREAAKANESKSLNDPTRISPGEYYRINWEMRYKDLLKYTSDKRYHYLGSAECYLRMGKSMGNAMIDLLNEAKR